MEQKNNIRLRVLSIAVIGYMLLALAWWSYLLYIKNNDAYFAKAELLKITKIAEGKITNIDEFHIDPDFIFLKKEYTKQERMILGETLVLALTLMIGIWLINRGYQRQTEAAQQSRNFLLSITHELKSPLASIKLILQTFTKRDLDREKIQKFSRNALNETDRLETLVENLLLAARLENTSIETYSEEIELLHFLNGIRESILAKTQNVEFELLIAEEAKIFADNKGMTSVFINLIENAIKYSDKPVSISIRHLSEGKIDKITISDNGWGIPPAEKKKVFDKFYRIGNEDTRKTKGTGLGLYIINRIIKSHKGTINISDNHPKGTTFTISLPKLGS